MSKIKIYRSLIAAAVIAALWYFVVLSQATELDPIGRHSRQRLECVGLTFVQPGTTLSRARYQGRQRAKPNARGRPYPPGIPRYRRRPRPDHIAGRTENLRV